MDGREGGLPVELDWERLERYWARWPAAVRRRRSEISYRIGPILLRLALGAEPVALAPRLRCQLEELGPAFVKFGQCLAARFGSALHASAEGPGKRVAAWLAGLSDELRRPWEGPALLDTGGPSRTIRQDLGREAAARFDIAPGREAPVAATALGHVFRWRLGGREVAVKVQRPGLREAVSLDLLLLHQFFSGSWTCLFPPFAVAAAPLAADAEIRGLLAVWAANAWAELNYEREGRDQERFSQELLSRIRLVQVPSVHWAATRGRVLTTDWVDGVRLADSPACGGLQSLVAGGLVTAPATLPAGSLLSLALQVTSSPFFSTSSPLGAGTDPVSSASSSCSSSSPIGSSSATAASANRPRSCLKAEKDEEKARDAP